MGTAHRGRRRTRLRVVTAPAAIPHTYSPRLRTGDMSSHSSRGSRVRTKVVALLVSMAALWAFAAYVTLRDGTNLLSLTTFAAKVGKPSEDMVANLQKERRASLVFLADSSAAHRDALNAQRELTDQTAATYATNVADTTVGWLADDALKQRFGDVTTRLGGLTQSRAS